MKLSYEARRTRLGSGGVALLLGLFCFGCSDVPSEPAVVTPTRIDLWPQFGTVDGLRSYATMAVLAPGESVQGGASAVATVPAGSTVSQLVDWESSAPSVASVDATGKVTAHAGGDAIITASARRNHAVHASSTVTVLGTPPRFVSLAVGAQACGLTAGGSAFCWEGKLETLGNGQRDLGPVLVAGGHSFKALSAGGYTSFGGSVGYVGPYHTCGIDADGVLYCWGTNSDGQLGDGTTTNRSVPTRVAGDRLFKSVSAGRTSTCAIGTDDLTYCWGGGGGLGNGDALSSIAHQFAPAAVEGGLRFTVVSSALQTCGLVADGTAYCWGSTPSRVPGDIKFVDIVAGPTYACARTAEGTVYCWGATASAMGLGEAKSVATPTIVGNGQTFVSISAAKGSYSETCGVATDGRGYCWGDNFAGSLGDGTTTPRNTPTAIPAPQSFSSIGAGSYFSCGLASGKAYCWGDLHTQRMRENGSPTLITGQAP